VWLSDDMCCRKSGRKQRETRKHEAFFCGPLYVSPDSSKAIFRTQPHHGSK
jgi:hypothetical protein